MNTSSLPAVVGSQMTNHAFVKENNHHDAIAECKQQLFDYPENDFGGIPKKDIISGYKDDSRELSAEYQLSDHPEKDCGDIPMKKSGGGGSSSFKNIKRDLCAESANKDKQTPSSKPSVETAVTSADPESSLSKSKPSQEPNHDVSVQKPEQSENRTSNSSPCLCTDAPSDECSAPLQEKAKNRRILFPTRTPPTLSRSDTEEVDDDNDDPGDGSFYNCFAICCDIDDMSSVFSEVTLDAIFGKSTPSPPVLPIVPLKGEIEQGDVWAIELLDGKHQKGDTLWFRLSGHGEADEAVHFKDLEGIEVLDYIHAVTKVQESAMFYILKDNGEGIWVESDWVKDAMVEILMQSKRDEAISIPTLRSLRKKNKKRKKRWFPWPRSSRPL
jgi:hypothetical protein